MGISGRLINVWALALSCFTVADYILRHHRRTMKFVGTLGFCLVIVVLCSATNYDPSPNPEAVVQVGKARFTALTEHLVRMEWGGANDAATFAFVNRNLPTPKFTTTKDGNWTLIQTSAVEVSPYYG